MNSMTAMLALKALDGLSMRATAIARNVANAGTDKYQPVRVSFEDALRAAAAKGASAIRAVNPALGAAPGKLGHAPELRLDLELAEAAKTGSRYAAVIEVLNRQLQIDGLAATRDR